MIGWFTAFISQCVAESNGLLRPGIRHPWFTIWVELFLMVAIGVSLVIEARLNLLIIALTVIGVSMSVLAVDITIYSDYGSLEGMAAGYLIMAIANLLILIYYCIVHDNGHGGFEDKGSPFNHTTVVSNTNGPAGGVIGSFPGSGLRNRFSMGKNPMKKSGQPEGVSNVGMGSGVSSGVVAPTTGTGAGLTSGVSNQAVDMSSNRQAYTQPEEVAIGVPNSTSTSNAASMPTQAVHSTEPTQEVPYGAGNDMTTSGSSYPPTYMNTQNSGNLAPPITSAMGSETTAATTGAATGAAAGAGAGMAGGATAVAMEGVQRAEALYSYKANADDPTEISFNKGDILQIVDSSGKWWQAQRPNGELGIVPSNYLRML